MAAPIKWMAKNHVAANLLMAVLIVGGLMKSTSVKQEVFPEVTLDMIQVSVAYPGAGPSEVEEGIVLQIEEALSGVDGIKEMKSTANEGSGSVVVELSRGVDDDLVLSDIKSAVDRIITFPVDAEKPLISKILNRSEVILVIIAGDVPERSLREQAELIRDELLENPKITQVELGGVKPYEITVEINEASLSRYGLTINQVASRLREASLDLPAGTIKTSGGNILLRTKEKRYDGSDYKETTIKVNSDGTEVKLKDIATVVDGFTETDEIATFDGLPAAMVKVFRVGDQKPIELARYVKSYVEEKQKKLPQSLKIATLNDKSELFEGRMNLLIKNAVIGLILVVIILGLFLEMRLAFWIMLGIPISFLGAIMVMPLLGVSINMISLFAFIMALGIVVDDAIVVGENIFEHRQLGKPYLKAAIDGTIEVFTPVTFSILTTVVAFLPLAYIEGRMGKFIGVIPVIVITVLMMSLIESLFILPAHLSLGEKKKSKSGVFNKINTIEKNFALKLKSFIEGPYKKLLVKSIHNRYATVALAIAVMFLIVGTLGGGIVKFRFFPAIDGDTITASVKMPPGTPIEKTKAIEKLILEKAYEVIDGYDELRPEGDTILRNIYSVAGGTLQTQGHRGDGSSSGSHLATIAIFLTKSELRNVPSREIGTKWREAVGEIPGAEAITFTSNLMSMGANIDIELAHKDFEVLNKASIRIKNALSQYPNVTDIEDNFSSGKQELKIELNPEARTLGITEEDLGRQVRSAFFGAEAVRLQRGRNEVRVMVRYPAEDRVSIWNLEQMRIRTKDGGEIPLFKAATVTLGRGFSEITRVERKRVINVKATAPNGGEILSDLSQNLLVEITDDYPGLTFSFSGEEKSRSESMGSMGDGFKMAMFGIFVLLAIALRSYLQPFLIMSAIPFGIIGAVMGHIIMGFDLSIMSMFGMVALSGVVINDSLLLIDKVNRDLRAGSDLYDSVIDAGLRRFRPIVLTSLTTFFGLIPMIMETSVQAQFLIPMAISLAFGILFATLITLILIPSLYLVLEDIRFKMGLAPTHAPDDQRDAGLEAL